MKNTFMNDVSNCLDDMIKHKIGQSEMPGFEVYIADKDSWFNRLIRLRQRYRLLTDSEALDLAPLLAHVFDVKTEMIIREYDYDPELVDKLLIEMSMRRREFGFDERAKRIKKNNSYERKYR